MFVSSYVLPKREFSTSWLGSGTKVVTPINNFTPSKILIIFYQNEGEDVNVYLGKSLTSVSSNK